MNLIKIFTFLLVILTFIASILPVALAGALPVSDEQSFTSFKYVPGWLEGWEYRKKIAVNGSTLPLTDYQVMITIPFISGAMKTDYSDIRFSGEDGATLLNYWLDSYTSSSAVFWVKVPSIPTTGVIIYLYYGSAAAVSASNGDDTFVFFDDYSTDKLAGYTLQRVWSSGGPGSRSVSIENGQLRNTGDGRDNDESYFFTRNNVQLDNLAVDVKFVTITQQASDDWRGHALLLTSNQTAGSNTVLLGSWKNKYTATYLSFSKNVADVGADIGSDTALDGTGTTLTLAKAGSEFKALVNGVVKWGFTDAALGSQSFFAGMRDADGWYSSSTSYWDNFRIRNYALPEPTTSFIGEPVTPADWSFKKVITVDHTKVANTDQADFPVLINRTDAAWKDIAHGGHVAQADGGDFVFAAADGTTRLSHEIEKYDPATGELIAWVRVPVLSATSNTFLNVYYGNEVCANQWSDDGSVWNANYKGVWHLKETSGTQYDSTINHNNGAPNGGMNQGGVAKIGGGDILDGNDDYVDFGTSMLTTGATTTEYWINPASNNKAISEMFVGGGGHLISLYSDNRIGTGFRGYQQPQTPTSSITLDAWNHVAVLYSGSDKNVLSNWKIYINGIEQTLTWQGTTMGSSTTRNYIGRQRDGYYFNGSMDEVRISDVARSADWVKTSFNNQSSPGTFAFFGDEAALNLPSVTFAGTVLMVNGTGPHANGIEAYAYMELVREGIWGESFGNATAENTNFFDGGADSNIRFGNFTLTAYEWIDGGDHRVYSGGYGTIEKNGITVLTTTNARFTMDVNYAGNSMAGTGWATIDAENSDAALVAELDPDATGQVNYTFTGTGNVVQADYGIYDFNITIAPVAQREAVNARPAVLGPVDFAEADLLLNVNAFTPGGLNNNLSTVFVDQIFGNPGGTPPAGIQTILPDCYWQLGTLNNAINTDITFDLSGLPGVTDADAVRILKRDNAASPWVIIPNQMVPDSAHVKVNGINGFSDFAIGVLQPLTGAAGFVAASNSYIVVPDSNSLDVTNALTMEAWVNPSGGGEWALIFGKQYNAADANPWYSYRLLAASANSSEDGFPRRISFNIAPEGSGEVDVVSNTVVQNGVWTHVAGVYDGATLKIYINGVLENTVARTGNIRVSTLPLYIGKAPWTNYNNYNGLIDEVRVWNVARTAEQIQNDMYQWFSGTETGLAGYWPFDEGTGTVAADKTPNTNNGTLNNGAYFSPSGVPVPELRKLTITQTGNGTVSPTEGYHNYVANTVINLVATPNPGNHFVNWTGDTASVADLALPVTTVLMDGDFTITANFAVNEIADGGVSWWKLDETVGTVAFDSWTGSNGALTNGPARVPGQSGNALSFDGIDDYVQIPNTISKPASNLSLEAWVNVPANATKSEGHIFEQQKTFYSSYVLRLSAFKPQFILDNNADGTTYPVTAELAINDGEWHHIAGTYDGTTMRLYVDGIEVATGTAMTGNIYYDGTTGPRIGVHVESNTFFSGIIDEVKIYSRTLTANEIRVEAGLLPQYILTITSNPMGGGTVTKNPDQVTYLQGTVITINALPAEDYQFVNWTGDVANTTSASTTVTMNTDKTVTANFVLNTPYADFTFTPAQAAPNQAVTFDANLSFHYHPQHSIVRYEWDFNVEQASVPNPDPAVIAANFFVDAQGIMVSHNYDQFGTYYPVLKVTDDQGLTAYRYGSEYVVMVNLGNQAPVADAGGPYYSFAGNPVIFDGSGSYDSDESAGDSIVSYQWNIANGAYLLDEPSPSLSWEQIVLLGDGEHPVTLTVMDNFGESDTSNTTLIVSLVTYTLTVDISPDGGGMVDKLPDQTSYASETTVQLTALPTDGWVFSHWSGAIETTENPITIMMGTGDITITAHFAPEGITLIGLLEISPELLEGQTVTIEGVYRGWETKYGPPPVTRSDWIIEDSSGDIYVTGNLKGLRYPDDLGKIITVTGIVRITAEGQVYIEIPRGRTGAPPVP